MKSGFGRLKLRHLDNANFAPRAFKTRAYAFTPSSADRSLFLWPSPLATGAKFVKCVLFEPEDMSNKTDISDIYIQLNARWPDGEGKCSSNSSFWGGVVDSSRDIRHMAKLQDNVTGKCMELQVKKRHVTSSGSVVYFFCYYSSKYDYQNVAD